MDHAKEKRAIFAGLGLIALVFFAYFLHPHIKEISSRKIFADKTVVSVPVDNVSEEIVDTEKFPLIATRELQEKIITSHPMMIIDIRESEDFEREHIIDSISLSSSSEKAIEAKSDSEKNSLIVIVGYGADTTNISQMAQAIKKDQGYENIRTLEGGIASWKKDGYPLVTEGDPDLFSDHAKITYIEASEVKKSIDENYPFFLLDVRSPAQFQLNRLAGSENIPFGQLESRRKELPYDREIVVYGESPLQGFKAGVRLYDLHVFTVKVLSGTADQWEEADLEFIEN